MAEPEREIIQARLRELTADERRFRINAGQGWTGDALHVVREMTVHVHPGDVVLRSARVFHGAPIGWPDLAGWDSVVIRPEDVPPEGLRLAVVAFDEAKSAGVRMSREQGLFRAVVERMGGRFKIIKSPPA